MLKMNLTLSPLVSLDNQLLHDKEKFCGRWILKHKPLVSGAPTGTTFPPFSQHLPYFTQRTETPVAKPCKSEPDLNSDYQCENLEDDHDEDYLFEFDIGSPASSEEGHTDKFEQDAIINVMKEEDDSMLLERMSTVSTSESTSSSCSHRKESGVVADVDGFSSIFGSFSNGFERERRSSTCMTGDEDSVELEGMAVNPEEWKENSALYLGGKLATLRSSEGSSTPILAASPLTTHTSPLVSPDSVISEDLDIISPRSSLELCEECQTDKEESEQKTQADVNSGNSVMNNDNTVSNTIDSQEKKFRVEEVEESSQQTSDDIIERLCAKLKSSTETTTEKFQINPSLVVSTEKLNNLLHKLESDKLYHTQGEDSLEDEDEEDQVMSPLPRTPRRDSSDKPRLRKCSSLKTSKTPPTTPGRRKIVRFADILGLDLSEVKTFSDEIPKVPRTAFADLDVSLSDVEVGSPVIPQAALFPSVSSAPTASLVPMFNQPGGSSTFLENVTNQKISLENAFMEGPYTVVGFVRVLNISFHKSVTVRWTCDDWRTTSETEAEWVAGSSAGNTDKFSFRLVSPVMGAGARLMFCLRYECSGEFWDSNNGNNYVFQVLMDSPKSAPPVARTIPAPVPITNMSSSRNFRVSTAAAYSPSLGDDPWLRFM